MPGSIRSPAAVLAALLRGTESGPTQVREELYRNAHGVYALASPLPVELNSSLSWHRTGPTSRSLFSELNSGKIEGY